MAFWDKYKIELSDVNGALATIEVQEDSVAGSTTYLTGTGSPLRFEFNSDSDDYNEPVRPSKAVFSVYSNTNFALTDFYSDEDFRLKVNIKYGSTLFWTGFVITSEYSEPYNDTPYPVTITAVDGINYLKNINYDNSGTPYDGRKRISKILLDILGKIYITAFTEYINIYEVDMLQTVDDSPFDQSYIDVDVFKEMTCYEVLQAVLSRFNAVIRQDTTGKTVIYRPDELIQTTVYGRTFTAETTKTSTSYTAAQQIGRSQTLKQLPGSALMIQPALKKITLNQDYGYKESWIENWELTADTWDGSDTFENWISASGTNAIPISSELGEGDNGAYLNSYDAVGAVGYYIRQEFGTYAVADVGTQYALEFDYLVHNTTAADVASLVIGVRVKHGTHYLLGIYNEGVGDDGFATWQTPAEAFFTYTMTAVVGTSGWIHFKKDIIGLQDSGPLEITLYASNKADVYVAFKNIKFYNYSATLSQKQGVIGYRPVFRKARGIGNYNVIEVPVYGTISFESQRKIVRKVYEVTNSLFGKELSLNYIVGDVLNADVDVYNVIEQFAGSIGKPGFDYRVDTVTLTGGEAGAQADITCNNETQTCEFDTDLSTTAAKFVTDHAAAYASVDVTVTSSGADIIFTNDILGEEFLGDTIVTPDLGTLDGTVELTTPARPDYVISNTEVWSTRTPGGEADPLLEIVGGEIGNQYSRPKQLIQMNIYESGASTPVLNLIGNLQDALNTIGGNARKFVVNSAEYDYKMRIWNIDLMEIIE